MAFLNALVKKSKLFFYENIYARKIDINLDHAIFSFTFDDVPVSAVLNGARILEAAKATGTYYVASSLNESNNSDEDFLDGEQIMALYRKGHDIGCHTFSHINLRKCNSKLIINDCVKNTDRLITTTGKESIEHFAYPFGMVSPWGKKVLGKKYKTLRTTDSGVNNHVTDMTHLRAINLYTKTFNRKHIKKCITDAVSTNGWIIFYTHDVKENPTRWGTTAEDLIWVVDECLATSGKILNISEAYNLIMKSQENN